MKQSIQDYFHSLCKYNESFLKNVIVTLLVSAFVSLTPALAEQSSSSNQTSVQVIVKGNQLKSLKFEDPPEPIIPSYSTYELPNGLKIFLLEDHEVPLIGGQIIFHGGPRSDPSDKLGLARLSSAVLRTGGSERTPGETLNQILEDKAASIEASSSGASTGVSFGCLSEDLDQVLELFSEVVRTPAFPNEQLKQAKIQAFGAISRRNDDPNGIVGREALKLIYGDSSPYAVSTENKTIRKIERKDLLSFHRSYFAPNNALLGVVGDFDSETLKRSLETYFGDWQRLEDLPVPSSISPEVDRTAANQSRGKIYLVDKPELSQAYVRIGSLGGRLDDPDYFAMDVLNQVLNGLSGRMFNEIRSKAGLAYSVYAQWVPAFDHPGIFYAGGETSSEQVAPFISKIISILDDLNEKSPVTESEVNDAKLSTLNAFVFNFTDTADILSRVMKYAFYGYPEDFAQQYKKGIENVSASEVTQAVKDHIHTDDLSILVLGNQKILKPQLQSTQLTQFPVLSRSIQIPK
eukprot:CAMPEP_0182441794 /NCGR_PEP_ID=MMETSP1172-20130603/793_1 /TAXON_ID=708627 /ORGANISM="Timspurckia oligopyrenoides, Strain CCMP3278" /LENGTH=518 /DNA_ID=CAMNT_0024636329 /DNA_START=154 /DNA_END=1710 /DNA_ORIENTATION=-